MTDIQTLKNNIVSGDFKKTFADLYVDSLRIPYEEARYIRALDSFSKTFSNTDIHIFSAPGRSEIGGNHTDHQRGEVLAASINNDILAIVSPTDDMKVSIMSEGYKMITIPITDTKIVKHDSGTTIALIRGVIDGLKRKGHVAGGFNAYVTSDVLRGSGLSSSAAFETLIGTIENGLYNNNSIDAVEIAEIGQYAENIHFGKPCGLMDQMACSVGSLCHINFINPENPFVEKVDFDFENAGYSLCITDTKGSHADLTDDYAAIPAEMKEVASFFGKNVLSEVPYNVFWNAIPDIRAKKTISDRAILRAIHFYGETKRAHDEYEALKNGNLDEFFYLFKESGDSSFKYLQNVYTCRDITNQNVAIALAVSQSVLGPNEFARVHGGGFAGTIQAFVKNDNATSYQTEMDKIFGKGSCCILKIRQYGGFQIV